MTGFKGKYMYIVEYCIVCLWYSIFSDVTLRVTVRLLSSYSIYEGERTRCKYVWAYFFL